MSTLLNLFKPSKTQSLNKTYIIAEIGVNHNGDIESALDLMRISARAGVDAVKFQKRSLSQIYTPQLLKDPNSAEWSFQYLLPQLKQLELSNADYLLIDKYAQELEIDLIITPFDLESAKFISRLSLAAIKIASADMTNWPLLQEVVKGELPLIISTGMWSGKQISDTAKFIKKKTSNFALLHCQSTYPAPFESINLSYLNKLKNLAPVVGYSGHERGISVCLAALGMGAKIIEKHITLDRDQKGPDHRASLEPQEFETLVEEIRKVEKSIGSAKKIVKTAEVLNREVFAKSLTANKNLPSGHLLTKQDIILLSPGKGIPPSEIGKWLGKKLVVPKKKYQYFSTTDFQTIPNLKQWQSFSFTRPWGLKCRFHDYHKYKPLNTPVIEFHCSEKDVDVSFAEGNHKSALIVHAPEIIGKELFDLCSKHPHIRRNSINLLNKTIKTTNRLKKHFNPQISPKMVIHFGGMAAHTEQFDTDKMMKIAEESLKQIKRGSVELLVENLPPRPWYLGGQWYQHAFMKPNEIKDFCSRNNLGMTLDICHAQLYCDYFKEDLLEYIKTVLPVVKHLHISDATGFDGEGVQVGQGDINFDKVFKLLSKTSFTWVPEIWGGHNDNDAGNYQALKLLSKYKSL